MEKNAEFIKRYMTKMLQYLEGAAFSKRNCSNTIILSALRDKSVVGYAHKHILPSGYAEIQVRVLVGAWTVVLSQYEDTHAINAETGEKVFSGSI